MVTIIVQSPSPSKIECLLLNALDLVSEHTNIYMCVLAYIACVLHAWCSGGGRAGLGSWARSPLVVAEVLVEWLEAHHR